MNTVIIDKRICLESKYLNSKINDHIFDKLQIVVSSECTKEHGHIIKVNKVIAIISHEIDRANSENVFTVQFEADTLKPEKNTIMTGKVCMVYKDGIFITVMNRQKMLIPRMYLNDYNFDEVNECYRFKNDDTITISEGDDAEAVVTASQYSKNNFSCFGSLKSCPVI
jgi:DNA-directed RNA polymerase subunit E'/Rpb7